MELKQCKYNELKYWDAYCFGWNLARCGFSRKHIQECSKDVRLAMTDGWSDRKALVRTQDKKP